jgi:hypothetical protein
MWKRFCRGREREVWHWWEGEVVGKRGRRVNKVQIMYTHICKCKNDTC